MYNTQHGHGGIGWPTPAMVHYGQVPLVRAQRQQVLTTAYAAHPDRFVPRPPEPPAVPDAVWINPPAPNFGPVPRIQEIGSVALDGERRRRSRSRDLEAGRDLATPGNDVPAVSLAALALGVRQ